MPKHIKPPKYLGTADIAGMGWCEQKFLFRSKKIELMFKDAYEEDCKRFGKNAKVERLNKHLDRIKLLISRGNIFICGEKFHDIIKTYGHPETTLEELADKFKSIYKDEYEEIGRIDEQIYGRKLPTLRYHFKFKDYIIEAVPDGITDDYCYEFKSTGNRFLYYFIKPCAIDQAMLYSYFFKRKNYVVEIYMRDEGKKEVIEGKLDKKKAKAILNRMDKLLRGVIKPRPPKPFKCKNCHFSKECPIRQT